MKPILRKALHQCNAFRHTHPLITWGSLIILLSLIALLCLILSTPPFLMVIEEYRTGRILWSTAVEPGTAFHYEFTHSVALSQVIEKFTIGDDGSIILMEAWNEDYGAGLPYDVDLDQLDHEDGFFIIRNIGRTMETIHMQPTHIQPRYFYIQDQVLALHKAPYARTHLVFHVQDHGILDRIGFLLNKIRNLERK